MTRVGASIRVSDLVRSPDAITAPSWRIVPASSKPRSKLALASSRCAGPSVAKPGEEIAFAKRTKRSS